MIKKSIYTEAIKIASVDDFPFFKCINCGRLLPISNLDVSVENGEKVYRCLGSCIEESKN